MTEESTQQTKEEVAPPNPLKYKGPPQEKLVNTYHETIQEGVRTSLKQLKEAQTLKELSSLKPVEPKDGLTPTTKRIYNLYKKKFGSLLSHKRSQIRNKQRIKDLTYSEKRKR